MDSGVGADVGGMWRLHVQKAAVLMFDTVAYFWRGPYESCAAGTSLRSKNNAET